MPDAKPAPDADTAASSSKNVTAAQAASKLTYGNFSLINKLATSSIWRPDCGWQAMLRSQLHFRDNLLLIVLPLQIL